MYVVLLPDNDDARARDRDLRARGHRLQPLSPSIHLQPYMRERYGFSEGMCPVSEDVSSRSLALPFFTGIQPDAQERVAEVLASAL